MSTKELYLTGTCKWCKYLEPNKYGRYTINMYLDEKSETKLKESGSRVGFTRMGEATADEDGRYYIFSRKAIRNDREGNEVDNGRPVIFDADNNVIDDERLIGNGSEVTIKVRVYQTSMGPGTEWLSLRTDNLVEYNSVEKDLDIDEPF